VAGFEDFVVILRYPLFKLI